MQTQSSWMLAGNTQTETTKKREQIKAALAYIVSEVCQQI
jgi:hypothetical protein